MGASREGNCKLCRSPMAPALNTMIVKGTDAGKAARAMEQFGLKFTRHTFYKHLEHITHPLITAVDKARRNPLIVPKTNHGALEMVRELGMRQAVDHPEDVTVDHALKAAAILQASEKKGDNILVIMSKAVMADVSDEVAGYIGNHEDEPIEGNYQEVPTVEE